MSFRLSKSKLLDVNNGGLQNVLEKTKTNLIGHCLSCEI